MTMKPITTSSPTQSTLKLCDSAIASVFSVCLLLLFRRRNTPTSRDAARGSPSLPVE